VRKPKDSSRGRKGEDKQGSGETREQPLKRLTLEAGILKTGRRGAGRVGQMNVRKAGKKKKKRVKREGKSLKSSQIRPH